MIPLSSRLIKNIQSKTALNLLISGVALLLASMLLIILQFIAMRSNLVEDAQIQADIISNNSSAALLFDDKSSGNELLTALAAAPNLQAAGIFHQDGRALARYQRDMQSAIPAPGAQLIKDGHQFSLSRLDVLHAVTLDQRPLGFVTMRLSLQQFYLRLLRYAALTLLVAMASMFGATLLFRRLRQAVDQAQSHLRYLAHNDSVTNLRNRHAFNEHLAHALRGVDQLDGTVGLLLLDLDDFKTVNDTLGHQTGDMLLKLVAQRLALALRGTDILCRIGGDEFAVITERTQQDPELDIVARKILDALTPPFQCGAHEIHVSASIGTSCYPQDAADAQTLIRSADTAMYQAKYKGKNTFAAFAAEMDLRAQKRRSLESALRKAIAKGQMQLHYQPQAQLQDLQIVGAEALLRWNHPELGPISPVEFIPIAEESGLIVELGQWVLQTACRQAAAWHQAGLGPVRIAVNLSARQARDPNLLQLVTRTLHETALPAHLLELEITESMLMENVDANITLLEQLHRQGIQLSIDDFGTGYSSMSYLKRFPIDQLKIDRHFVRDIPGNGDDEAISNAIISMAHSLGMSVVAEGVESAAQQQFMRAAGCDIMQGYYFARPMPACQLTALLHENALQAPLHLVHAE